ncbi:hypothetical protein HYH03_011692 [Edaphochlamys debaryana]|uniref:Uncharacterized protein n=1 Tax=Edaphochlamys debaryana TaxID=47281 RepID=A0A835XZR2_9CHLO|nr:hypothetical protein HYH03_011692 [Edaphochlamys debaryana]|eukprot:KAG2489890.1 hypothetical protein HYH03_011692 [Edaphochlamys debaryana]
MLGHIVSENLTPGRALATCQELLGGDSGSCLRHVVSRLVHVVKYRLVPDLVGASSMPNLLEALRLYDAAVEGASEMFRSFPCSALPRLVSANASALPPSMPLHYLRGGTLYYLAGAQALWAAQLAQEVPQRMADLQSLQSLVCCWDTMILPLI